MAREITPTEKAARAAARVLYDNWDGVLALPRPVRELAEQGHFFSALRLIFEPDADLRRQPAAPVAVGDGWTVVPEEMTNELLAVATKGRQVLAYEKGRYYNAWMEFDASEGGWLWMEEADSEPSPSHYRALPSEPGETPDLIPAADGDAEVIEALRLSAAAIREWMPETLPANEQGQIHFARAIAESAAEAIEKFFAARALLELTNEQKEIFLLRIIVGMGGETDSGDHKWNWLNWFCKDEVHGKHSDTFNRCHEKGWLETSHDTSHDTSTTWITASGRAAAAERDGGGAE